MPKPRLSATIRIPPDLAKALRTRPTVRAIFSQLAPSHQRRYVEWISSAVKETTRRKRISQAISRIAAASS